jgi:hypothetical protein
MPSASHRRAHPNKTNAKVQAHAHAEKTKSTINEPAAKNTEFSPPVMNKGGVPVHTYTNAQGENQSLVETTLPTAWPRPGARLDDPEDPDSGMHGWVTERGQEIHKSLGSAFEWSGLDIDADSVYNAASPKNPFHDAWLRDNKKGVYATMEKKTDFVPLNLQNAVEEGFDFSTPEVTEEHSRWEKSPEEETTGRPGWSLSKHPKPTDRVALEAWKRTNYGTTECAYFAKNQCKNGDDCRFLHTIDKSDQSNRSEDNVCWFWKQHRCTKGDDCTYDHFE